MTKKTRKDPSNFDEKTNLLLEKINDQYEYDFRGYSQATVHRRLIRFMQDNSINELDELENMLLKNSSLFFEHFLPSFTITVTEMFRDPSFFKAIRDYVVPVLSTYPFIRIWDAGCSTGEELFSLAILLKEEQLLDRTTIYATDINQKVLQNAQKGIFEMNKMSLYLNNYHKAGGKRAFTGYFVQEKNRAIFDISLIKNVVFYPHNLVVDGSFNEFHLILCRNVLIYFKKQLQENVYKLFCDSLIPLGFLGLGDKETIMLSSFHPRFKEVTREEKIFRFTS